MEGLSRSDIELKLESQVKALEERLRESESTRLDQKVQMSDLQASFCELNRTIKDLERRNSYLGAALTVLGILFASSIVLVHYTYQGYDLFTACYITGKTCLNALLASLKIP
ncbi:MAG: hypothetical protein ACE14P_00100 [Methanotrichaceae archaeon]